MKENKVEVFVDGGCSMYPEEDLVKELGIGIIPLDIKFLENGEWVSYVGTELSADEFYSKMRSSKVLPQTSGAITGRAVPRFLETGNRGSDVISVHITSKHSASWQSGVLAREMAIEQNPDLVIEIMDSRNVSIGTWFLAEQAVRMANDGCSIEEIKETVLEYIPKVDVFTIVANMNNLVKGGRVPAIAGMLGNILHLNPIVGLVDGEIVTLSKTRTMKKAKGELVSRVKDTSGIVKLAVIHTNDYESALEVRKELSFFYDGEIFIKDPGPVFGVHLGEKSVGIALLRD